MLKKLLSIIILFSFFATAKATFYEDLKKYIARLNSQEQKKVACVVAQMAGDVFGRPYELQNFERNDYSSVVPKDNNGGHLTDDSSRAWSTMDACLSSYLKTQGHFDERTFLLDFAKNNSRWLKKLLFSVTFGKDGGGYGSGKNTRAANYIYTNMKKKGKLADFPTAEVGIRDGMKQFGNGTIMGLSPIVFAQDKEMAKKIAVNQCKVSNNQKDLIEFTEFVAEIQFEALTKSRGTTIEDFFRKQIEKLNATAQQNKKSWQSYFYITLNETLNLYKTQPELYKKKLSSPNMDSDNASKTIGESLYGTPAGFGTSEINVTKHNYWLFGDLNTLYNQDWLIPSCASGACLIGVIYAILKVCGEKVSVSQEDFQNVMDLCLTMGHDVDTTAAIAGPLLAAFSGFNCLPQKLVNDIFENKMTKNPAVWQKMFFFYMNQMLNFSNNAQLEPISESLLSQIKNDHQFKSYFIEALTTHLNLIRKDDQPARRTLGSLSVGSEQSARPNLKDLGLGLTVVGSAAGITFAGYKYGAKFIKKAYRKIRFNYFKKRAPRKIKKGRRNLAK